MREAMGIDVAIELNMLVPVRGQHGFMVAMKERLSNMVQGNAPSSFTLEVSVWLTHI